jgi:hypothetical protein
MKEYVKPKAEAIVDALLDADQMESTARYLSSGRRFASLETEEIKQRWTEAVRIFLASYGKENPREMDDLGSELRLRKVPLPEENVRDQVAAVARRIQHDDDPDVRSRIRDHIRIFRDSLERPQN